MGEGTTDRRASATDFKEGLSQESWLSWEPVDECELTRKRQKWYSKQRKQHMQRPCGGRDMVYLKQTEKTASVAWAHKALEERMVCSKSGGTGQNQTLDHKSLFNMADTEHLICARNYAKCFTRTNLLNLKLPVRWLGLLSLFCR